MINDNILDFFYFFMDLTHSNKLARNHNIELSKVTSINPLYVGQMLRKPNKLNNSDFSLFLIENIGIFVIILIGFVLTVIAKFTLLKIIKQRYSIYNLLTNNGTRLSPVSFKFGFLSLAFSFFLFFNLNILTNMIKTQKVTVSTSEFLDSISKLNRTTKTLITLHKESMALFYRLIKKERKPNDSLVIYDFANFSDFVFKISKLDLDSYFYFITEGFFLFFVYNTKLLNRSDDHFVFFKPTIYFESLRTIFYRKKMDEKMKKHLNRR